MISIACHMIQQTRMALQCMREISSSLQTHSKDREQKRSILSPNFRMVSDPSLSVLTIEYQTRKGEKYAVCISFFELYQDRIYDLLDDSQSLIQKRKHLPLKRDVTSGRRFVSGLRKIYADTAEVSPSNHPIF